jgi:hypothetical protein
MTLETRAYNVNSSYHKIAKAQLLSTQNAINAAPPAGLGTAYSWAYYAQKQADTFPSLRTWIYLPGELLRGKNRRGDTVQHDFFVQSASSDMSEARRLITLARDTWMAKMGFRRPHAGNWFGIFDLKDYFSNPSSPSTIGQFRLEMVSASWQELPDDQPLVIRQQADFKLIFL